MKRALPLLLLVSCAAPAPVERTQWWREAKYGMFVHWGVYAVPAGEYQGRLHGGASEWLMHTARIPIAEYEKYPPRFNPVRFDARAWARLARAAGMKYLVITSKHHDGFAMYDTRVNDWCVTKATPWKRDPLRELADACRAEGIRFGLYYSILDWHEPSQKGAGKAAYVAKMKEQLREIVANYDPAVLWFDGEWEDWWTVEDGRDLARFVREIAPHAVVNNRVGKRGGTDGDYETPEQEVPRGGLGRPWETCMTTNNSWGFHKGDRAWKTPKQIVRLLAEIAGKGGNFLLNVGPTAEGEIPRECASAVEEAGRWVASNSEAIYGTTGFAAERWGGVTRKGDRLYAIVLDWPKDGRLDLRLESPVKRARLLGGGDVRLDALPPAPGGLAAVIAIDCDGEPRRAEWIARPEADGSIVLRAADATLHGGAIRIEHRHEEGNAGFWTRKEDWLAWRVRGPGEFTVELTYACAPGAGGEFAIGPLRGRVEPTSGWDAFRTMTVGRLTLPDGVSAIAVKPVAFTHAIMNLARLKLVPVR